MASLSKPQVPGEMLSPEEALALRTTMIETQLKPSGIVNPRTAAAFHAVDRQVFVDPGQASLAYAEAEPAIGEGRRLMRPRTLGYLIEKAAVQKSDRVLVVGAGTGYAAAVLGELAGDVVALESNAALATRARALLAKWPNVTVVEGPLEAGAPGQAPYSLIVFAGTIEELPDVFAAQLADDGRAAAVVRVDGAARAALGYRTGGTLVFKPFADATAPDLAPFRTQPDFRF